MLFTLAIFLGVVVITCVFALAIIPRFDRRPPLGGPQDSVELRPAPRASR